jgi:curved DNA-binding protein CbpA
MGSIATMSQANPYDVLQVSPKADAQVIRAAYRSLMQRYHPDKNPLDAQAAHLSASITQAYELLSDPQRKAALDAELRGTGTGSGLAAAPASRSRSRSVAGRTGKPALPSDKRYALVLPVIAVLICIALVWGAIRGLSNHFSFAPPAQQLSDIRLQIENGQTTEAERRTLFARKLSLLEQNPDLAATERSLRLDDIASRSLGLLTEPLEVRLAGPLNTALPSAQLLLPEITLVLGSFDAPRLQAHIQKHRARIVNDLAQQLASQSAALALSADAEQRIKRAIREAVIASLEIRVQDTYPSTYFESPGRHGVVDVILPKSFVALK